jgi:hypothetical protein
MRPAWYRDARQAGKRDERYDQTRAAQFLVLLFKVVAEAFLYCAYRTIDFLLLTRIQRGG